jgi:hypothetical protein
MTTAFGGGDEPPPKLELHADTAAAMASNAAVDRIKQRINRTSPRTRRRRPSPRLEPILRSGASHGGENARLAVSFQRPIR